MPSTKISTVFQATDNLTLNAYYEFEHRVNCNSRKPAASTSPQEVLFENSECFVLAGVSTAGPGPVSGQGTTRPAIPGYGFNLQHTTRPGTWKLHGCISTVPIASSRASTARSVGC
ncbi:MAG: hypothetical protein H6990_04155 [Pseudomonadales bacterium]|nr:hypothetical protein [Pseudomonadales bacterium]